LYEQQQKMSPSYSFSHKFRDKSKTKHTKKTPEVSIHHSLSNNKVHLANTQNLVPLTNPNRSKTEHNRSAAGSISSKRSTFFMKVAQDKKND